MCRAGLHLFAGFALSAGAVCFGIIRPGRLRGEKLQLIADPEFGHQGPDAFGEGDGKAIVGGRCSDIGQNRIIPAGVNDIAAIFDGSGSGGQVIT